MDSGDTGHLGGVLEDPRSVLGIADEIVLGKADGGEAEGVGVETAPGEAGGVGGDGDTVVVSAADGRGGSVAEETVNRCWVQYVGEVVSVALVDAGLAVVVQSPAVYGAVFVDGKGVVCTGANVGDAASQAQGCGAESAQWETRIDATAELALRAEAPGENAAFVVKS